MVITVNSKLTENELEQIRNTPPKGKYYLNNFDDFFILKHEDENYQFNLNIEHDIYKDIDESLVFSSNIFKKSKTVVKIKGEKIGVGTTMIAGPCAVEDKIQFNDIVTSLQKLDLKFIRGGLSKPRSNVYSFQGLEVKGVELIKKQKEQNDFIFVSEVVSIQQIEEYKDVVDIYQVGTRNMYNYELLKALGRVDKPVLLKRAMSATINEFLNAAEYIMANGNPNVILCERGIRTFETAYRNVLDLNAVVYLSMHTHLPIIVDPSHACGNKDMVEKLSLAAIAAGCDGLIIEVHSDPKNSISDAEQSLDIEMYKNLIKKVSDYNGFRYK